MATISIASVVIPNWQLGADVVLRVYALESFVAADTTIVSAGCPSDDISEGQNFFQQVSCSLSGTSLTLSALTLLSTTDSLDNAAAKYGAYFYTTEGQRLGAFAEFSTFFLPAAPSSTTWKAIAVAQAGV
jgi:hypothetical protein